MNNSFSKVAVWMVIALVLFTVFKQFDGRAQTQDGVTYTQFMDDAKADASARWTCRAVLAATCCTSPRTPVAPTR